MSKPASCLVIGAGLVGIAAARALARAGCRITLVDRGPPGAEASQAAAGMLAPQIEARAGEPGLPLALAARDGYARVIADCAAHGARVGYSADGITLVAFDDARAAELEAQVTDQQALGLGALWLDRAALLRRQPGIGSEARGALLAPRDGCVDNVALCAALLADAVRAGAIVQTDNVLELVVAAGRVTGVRTASGTRDADVVVLAAGAWSARLAGLPRPLPIEPVRGQMARVPWPEGEPRHVLFGRGAYVVPRGADALLGSTMEFVGFAKGTTDEGLARIRRETTALLPALDRQPASRSWSGLRPMTPDHRPIIGRDPAVAGLVYATGHGRNGILLGPLTGEIVCDLVVRGETRWDLAPYDITRFMKA